ncbi:MAG: serine/threonine protein kinase [Deltaproteobacteria bacterium]|nr:serine/threonine protein kinase [Deltaproteobacteria bacterium]
MGTPLESLTKLPRPFGPFTLTRLIAQGGMGQVFLALRPVEGEPTDEVCVVKTVRTDLREDREAVGRFLDEARIIQLLDHPAICHTLDAGVHDRTYFLALEFISGRNFRDIQQRALKLGRPLPDDVIFHGVVQMLEALSYAHTFHDANTGRSLGVVHRDVSPHNLMLGFDGYVKLIDFGLAAHGLKQEMTRPGIMVGKLRYNAPEQVRDRALDGRSDLYSAGVMLYELLVGERFYEGLSEEDIWRVAMKGHFRPRAFNTLPRTARAVLELALAPEPEERYPSAEHMKDAVLELARSRNVGDGRRACARFMADIFAEERQSERDMILQATGLAEARTRLFEAPSLSDEPSASASRSSLGRSHVVSPAQVRGRLADLLSQEFDPDAQTMLPQEPAISADDEPAGTGTRKQEDFEEDDATAVARSGRSARSSKNGDANTQRRSTPSSLERSVQRAANAPTRPTFDENLHVDRAATVPAVSPVPRVTAELRRREQTRAAAPSSRRVLAALGAIAVLLVGAVVVAAWIFLPHGDDAVVRVDPPPGPVDDTPDKPTEPAPPPSSDDPSPTPGEPATSTDAGAAAVAETAATADAGSAEEAPTPPGVIEPPEAMDEPEAVIGQSAAERARQAALRADKAKAKAAERERLAKEKSERERLAREKVERERMAKEQAERERTRPPVRELKTLKEQVAYLKEFCINRVACASPAVDGAKRFAVLSPDETKTLLSEINRCIQKCQR